jgi:hypothetical protein
MHHQQHPSYPHQFSSYPSANEWTGVPLIKSVDSATARHKKTTFNGSACSNSPVRSHGYEFDDCGNSIARMARHAHGSPIIVSGRFRKQPISALNGENGNVRNQNACNSSTLTTTSTTACDSGETHIAFDESGYHANGTCLPRIIKPRKRRKKDRKPLQQQQQQQTATTAEKVSSPTIPFTFSSSANDFMQTRAELKISSNNQALNENFIPPQHFDSNLFFNDFNINSLRMGNANGSTSSSPISLSNSSLSSSTGAGTSSSSCSCRLCDPNCKIWAFPLRRSFSDNAAVEIEQLEQLSSIDASNGHHYRKKKDVGVIGGNRIKAESNLCTNSSFAIMDLIEFTHNQNPQRSLAAAEASRLRSESLSDSGDSGCELLLSGLHISDDIISSTIKTVNDAFAIDSLNTITQQLSNFNLMVDDNSLSSSSFNDNEQLSYMNANNKLSSLNQHANHNNLSATMSSSSSADAMCKFSDHHHQLAQKTKSQLESDFDKLFAMNLTPSCSSGNYNNLVSPMLVNKRNYSIIDVNNNTNQSNNSVNNSAQSLCVNLLNENENLNERSSFQFDMPWKC